MSRLLRLLCLLLLLSPLSIFLGAGLNQAVLIANHDKFPVLITPERATEQTKNGMFTDGDPTHCVMTPQTHLNFLADIFDFRDSTQSIGDLLLQFGEWCGGVMPTVVLFLIIYEILNRKP